MAATDLTQYQLERLAFIRYLFKLGLQHAQDPGPQSSVAILLFHDAVELFLELASQKLHAKPSDSFMRYFSQLDEKLQPSPPLPLRENMRHLNDARNALKHKGLRPDRSDLEHYSNIVIRFFEEVTPRIFEVDMDSVSLVTVVRCETARKYLYAENARLQRRLARVETMLEIQKKSLRAPGDPPEPDRRRRERLNVAAEELAGRIGQTAEACEALGVSRSTLYRRRRPVTSKPKRRPRPQRALDTTERERVLSALHCERFVDKAPAQVWATLLDEGIYHCSIRTMYRILSEHGEVRERRNQLRHPNYQKPELVAEAPNQVWSWDITKLRGPVKWTYFYLYVILDIFSRYVALELLDPWSLCLRLPTSLSRRQSRLGDLVPLPTPTR